MVSSVLRPPGDSVTWSPPPLGVIKINVDAAFPGQVDDFYVGMVARDSVGMCVWWCRKMIVGRL